MKKSIIITGLVLFFLSQMSFAQITQIKKGDFTTSIGIGALPTYLADNGTTVIPPLSAIFTYRAGYNFSLSSYIGFSSTLSSLQILSGNNSTQWKNDFLMLGLRGEVHSDRYDKFDIYGGFMIGYNKPFIKKLSSNNGEGDSGLPSATPYKYPPAKPKVLLSGFIGTTYYFMKDIGVFTEVGYGVSIVNVGINMKL